MRGSVVSLGCQHKIYLFNKASVMMKWRKAGNINEQYRTLKMAKNGQ
ncbi:hypothetical protein [Candidatus Symbiopectobacterium sp.]|nr:hypothetical protein [Candidatus Symbiopectobacterium sp.]